MGVMEVNKKGDDNDSTDGLEVGATDGAVDGAVDGADDDAID